ncbi:MFS transporter [Altererythrobacter sp. KTW20L]|uniref:MFS transporter n=1 Tax=Altererythrobacter sp. KTW20L TaxID=2942210 RepID=UPI0020BE00EA|nr:MFS transporter [Altererythrobacter sp. KTW20L]MCL6251612.1 MFS transporter [Altererythrobacter sp. KTW20L]
MTDSQTTRTTPSLRGTILLLGAVAALGSLATQLLVPALPSIAGELGVGVASAQLVVGVFLIGLGAGQLLVGPLADRMERRRLLQLGLLIYTAASLLGLVAESLGVLLLARLGQAVGAAAGLVTARVLLNTMVPPERAVAAQAALMTVVLVSPAIAPVIGGLVTEWFGWRAIMGGLALAGIVAVLVVSRRIPRAGPAADLPDRPTLRVAYRRVLANRRFLAATSAMAFASASLYVFLGSAPFLLERSYGLTPRETGMCLLLVACASIAGTRVVGLVQRRTDALLVSTVLGVLAAATLLSLSWRGNPDLPLVLAPLVLLGLTAGLTGPTAISHILASEPGLEGTASSLAGALQMLASAFLAWMLGPYAAETAMHLGLSLTPLTGAALLAAIALRKS